MAELSEEEHKRIVEAPPKGTFAIFIVFGVVFTAAWVAMYFGRFIAAGYVS